ncbi:MAG: hypothetical protein JWM71_65 [Solirubrobacteraceae bacterium]|nr:hypothetical protein [Solirubrobacteraceae bacterium]
MPTATHVVDSRATLGESAVWHPGTQRLYWLDLAEPALFSFDPATNATTRRPLAGEAPLGGLALSEDHERLVVVKSEGIALINPATGEERWVAHPLGERRGLVYNDAEVDRDGRLWVGTLEKTETEAVAELFVLDAEGSWTSAVQGLVICNGPAFSRDGAVMYLSDTLEGVVKAFDVDAAGSVSGERIFARFSVDEGLPDGLAVDAEDGLWVAHWGGSQVSRWNSAGVKVDAVAIPTPNVTSVAFGGTDLLTMFVTTAKDPYDGVQRRPLSGALFCFQAEIPGNAPGRWSFRP